MIPTNICKKCRKNYSRKIGEESSIKPNRSTIMPIRYDCRIKKRIPILGPVGKNLEGIKWMKKLDKQKPIVAKVNRVVEIKEI